MDTYRREFDRARQFAVEQCHTDVAEEFATWYLDLDVEADIMCALFSFLAAREEGLL